MFPSVEDMQIYCAASSLPVWQAFRDTDAEEQGMSVEQSTEKMRLVWTAMRESIESYDPALRSRSGMVGGEGAKMCAYASAGEALCGDFVSAVISRALMLGASNACMHRIVAAPTAGACGVLPAVLYSAWERYRYSEEEILRALYVAAGFGEIIAHRASLSGAAGGCQAEIGSASGMAAAALVSLRGGTASQMGHGCAMALKNLMGLVCDPVAGLVEVPCVKRNVVGAVNALAAADMALAGIESIIPADQVIDAMRAVGDAMSSDLRETARGGVAASPRARELEELLSEKN